MPTEKTFTARRGIGRNNPISDIKSDNIFPDFFLKNLKIIWFYHGFTINQCTFAKKKGIKCVMRMQRSITVMQANILTLTTLYFLNGTSKKIS